MSGGPRFLDEEEPGIGQRAPDVAPTRVAVPPAGPALPRGPLLLDAPADPLARLDARARRGTPGARQQGAIDADPQQGGGAVWLEGLGAASWDVNGSAVEFFDAGGSMIDALRLTTPQAPDTLTVYARPDPTFGSTVVVGTGPFFGPPTGTPLLPYHHAAT